MKTTRLAFAVVVVLAGVTAAGCQSLFPSLVAAPDLPEPAEWVRSEPFACHDFEGLWERCKIHAARGGFRIDDDATSYSGRRIVTTWKLDLATASNAGRRYRRFVAVEDVPGMKNHFLVRVSTVVQRNTDIDDPLNPIAAKWRPEAPDLQDAERVAYVVAAGYRESGASPEFEAR